MVLLGFELSSVYYPTSINPIRFENVSQEEICIEYALVSKRADTSVFMFIFLVLKSKSRQESECVDLCSSPTS